MSDLHKAPKAIWLQVDPEGDGPGEWDTHCDATWCAEKINDNDIEYINSDRWKELERQRDELVSVVCYAVDNTEFDSEAFDAMCRAALTSVKGQQ